MIPEETIVHAWPGFFLRDDRATGIRDDEAYSLFRLYPYGRQMVYAGSLAWAIKECDEWIKLHGSEQ